MLRFFREGAKVFVCGSGRVADGVRDASVRMFRQSGDERGEPKSKEEAEEWFDGLRNERFMSDVFG